MKTKALYFLLGASVSTLAYFAGSITSTAKDDYTSSDSIVTKQLVVTDWLRVGSLDNSGPSIMLYVDQDENTGTLAIEHKSEVKNGYVMLSSAADGPHVVIANINKKGEDLGDALVVTPKGAGVIDMSDEKFKKDLGRINVR